jgi:hypothetical protein
MTLGRVLQRAWSQLVDTQSGFRIKKNSQPDGCHTILAIGENLVGIEHDKWWAMRYLGYSGRHVGKSRDVSKKWGDERETRNLVGRMDAPG